MGNRQLVLAAIIVVILFLAAIGVARENKDRFMAGWNPGLATGYPHNFGTTPRPNGNCVAGSLYSSAEVDPLITGRLYAGARAAGPGRRWVYGGRAPGGWGLREYSSGESGQTGVDVGPLGLREYSLDGRRDVFDDGIPEDWQLPSTPVVWNAPPGRDFYDVEARQAFVYDKHLTPLQEPDHDVLFN